MINLPPDRSEIDTELRNSRSMNIHKMSTDELVGLMNSEDAFVIEAVRKAKPAITKAIDSIHKRFENGGRLIYIGAGTSGRLGVLDASEIPPTFQLEHGRIIGIIAGGDSALRNSSEGLEDNPDGARGELSDLLIDERDTIVGIAAGSSTPYVLGAFRIAKELSPDCLTIFFTCTRTNNLVDVDHIIHIETGPELITGSTRMKAGTATKLTLNMISTALMIKSGRVYQNLMVDLKATNEKLRDRAARIIMTLTGLDREASFELLDEADDQVKVALVMHYRGVHSDDALRILSENYNRLDLILDNNGVK